MELITTEEIKTFLSKQADECGYTFDKANPLYQNVTRLEALKGHYNVLIEDMQFLHADLKPSEEQKKDVENWIEELEVKFVKMDAPKVGKLSGAIIKTHSLQNEVQL